MSEITDTLISLIFYKYSELHVLCRKLKEESWQNAIRIIKTLKPIKILKVHKNHDYYSDNNSDNQNALPCKTKHVVFPR